MSNPAPFRRRPLSTSPFPRPEIPAPTTSGYSVGDRVTLDRCGMGRVIAVTDTHVTVDFGELGVRALEAGTPGLSLL